MTPPQAPTPSPAPPPAPQPIAPGPAPQVTPETFGPFRVPQTPAEAAILRARRSEMSTQIISARERRGSLARQYERATGANKDGLEQQLRVLDQRIAQLEVDIGLSGQALASYIGPTTGMGVPASLPFNNYLSPGQVTAISIIFILFVLGPIAGSFGRLLWRRSTKPAMPHDWDEASHRLERLEQAVDTIAVEIERVSESQRFMTKILTQRDPAVAGENSSSAASAVNSGQPLPALGAGSPEPIVFQNQRDEVRVRRS